MCGHTQILQGGLSAEYDCVWGGEQIFFVVLIRLQLARIDLGHDG